MTGKRKYVAAAAALVLLAMTAGIIGWRATADTPLRRHGGGIGYLMDLPRKQTDFTMGLLLIEQPGKEVAVLAVKPRTSANVEFLGAFTVWPRDYHSNKFTASRQYPPRPPFDLSVRHDLGDPIPAAETAYIPPGEFTEPPPIAVMPGFRIRSGNMGAVHGVEIVYRVDGKTVRELYEHTAIACVLPRECNPREESYWDREALRELGLPEEF